MPDGSTIIAPGLTAALRYAAAGIAVFPVAVGAKTPPLVKAWETAATTDQAQIEAWWRQWPDANIGWLPAANGLLIVDLDCKADKPSGLQALSAIERERSEQLPPTRTIATPSGGEHRIYRGTMRTSGSRIAPGIDIRGGEIVNGELVSAGYGLLPPSVVAGRSYAWKSETAVAELPNWFAALSSPTKTEPRVATPNAEPDAPHVFDRGRQYLRGVVASGGAPVEGSRNVQAVRLANALGDFGLSEQNVTMLLEQEWAAHGEPPDELIGDIVASAFASRQNEIGSDFKPAPPTNEQVFGEAAQWGQHAAGSAPGGKLTFAQALKCLGLDIDEIDTAAPKPPDPPLVLSHVELMASAEPPAEYVLAGFTLHREVNLLYGDGKAGKTMWSLHEALAVAAGIPLFGLATRQMPVVVVTTEDKVGPIKFAVGQIAKALGLDPLQPLPISYICRPRVDTTIAVLDDDGLWRPGLFLRTLYEIVASIGECLLILDPIINFATLNENLRAPVHTLLQNVLDGFCYHLGATVKVDAHPSKTGLRDGSGTSGGTGWRNATRNLSLLLKDEPNDIHDQSRTLKIGGANYGACDDLHLSLFGPCFEINKNWHQSREPDDSREALIRGVLCQKRAYSFDAGLTSERVAEQLTRNTGARDGFDFDRPMPGEEERGHEQYRTWHNEYLKQIERVRNSRKKAWGKALSDAQLASAGTKPEVRWFLSEPPVIAAGGGDASPF